MHTLYMMVALPRSGKSTYVKEHFQHIAKISADQLRLLIHGERHWPEKEEEVWAFRKIMLEALLQQGIDICIDETNVTRRRRKEIIKFAKQYGYEVIAIVIRTDKEICKQRAILTNQEDLLPVIEEMAEHYQEVIPEEGFSEIREICHVNA